MSFTRIRCFSFVAFGPSVLTYLQVIGCIPSISVTKCPLTLTANFAVTSREKVIRYLRNSAPQIRQSRSAESSIGYTEITSVPPHDSAGRKSAEKPPSMILHKSVVIALGIAVGVVLLVAVVVAVWYRRRKNSEKAVLRGKPPEDEENIRLVDL